jgi:hypothetical protein
LLAAVTGIAGYILGTATGSVMLNEAARPIIGCLNALVWLVFFGAGWMCKPTSKNSKGKLYKGTRW